MNVERIFWVGVVEFITEANDIFVGLALNLCALLLVFVLAGRQFRQDRELVFMLGSINIVVFALSYTMLNVSLGVGAAFGLFALLGSFAFAQNFSVSWRCRSCSQCWPWQWSMDRGLRA